MFRLSAIWKKCMPDKIFSLKSFLLHILTSNYTTFLCVFVSNYYAVYFMSKFYEKFDMHRYNSLIKVLNQPNKKIHSQKILIIYFLSDSCMGPKDDEKK